MGVNKEPTYSADYFYGNFTRLMEMQGMNQIELARKAGMAQATINKLFHGKTEPSLYSFCLLCEALNAEPNWMLSEHTNVKD